MPGPLVRIPLAAPGRLGFNADQATSVQNHEWSLEVKNGIINDAERLQSRQGWVLQTTTGNHGNDTGSLHEYVVDSDTVEIISVAGSGTATKFYEGVVTLTDITNTASPSSTSTNEWQFVNFNGKVVGFHAGETPIVYTSGGAGFAQIAGSPPEGPAAVATHGRIFAVDADLQTIKFCALLDESDWTTASDAGSLNLANVWPGGLDIVVSLALFQDKLVIFGERSILVFDGLDDPISNLQLAAGGNNLSKDFQDSFISGTISARSVVSTGNDLIFLSRSGLRSLSRAIEYERLPLTTMAPQAQQVLISQIELALSNSESIMMEYHQPLGGIIIKIGGNYWFIDIKLKELTRMFKWEGTSFGFDSILSSQGSLYYGVNDGVALVTGYNDDGTDTYSFAYLSPWLPVGSNGRFFIPKRALSFVEAGQAYRASIRWSWDYAPGFSSASVTIPVSAVSEYSTEGSQRGAQDEYGAEGDPGFAEYGPRNQVTSSRFQLSGFGSFMQIGFDVLVDGNYVSLQEIDIFGKIGRLAS